MGINELLLFLKEKTKMINYDQRYGVYRWPTCLDVAKKFLKAAVYANSTAECLDDYFFFEYLDSLDQDLFYDNPEDEALELIEAASKSRQNLFKEAKKWSLDDLVASAIYFVLSTDKSSTPYMCWSSFFWVFLIFDEPIFDMLKPKGWNKMHRDQLQQSFRSTLKAEVFGGVTIKRVMWGCDGHPFVGQGWPTNPIINSFILQSNICDERQSSGSGTDNGKERPWFTCSGFARNVYPESVLRCLDLIGIDAGRAHLVVDEVFKLKSLAPLYDVLSNDTFPIDRSKVKNSFIANNNQKSSANLPISVRHFISLVRIFATVSFAAIVPRFVTSCYLLNLPPQTYCFAATSTRSNQHMVAKKTKTCNPYTAT